ncbi:MAG: Hint domain-containing protein [Paracoccus sp. (in: a-proteobacteria)]|nr:Hint domain-containing protein [Paracoccus sp. (in: a-proteobacteria)]
MATTPGITQTADGYTFNWVYTGGHYAGGTSGKGDWSGNVATSLFTNDHQIAGEDDPDLVGLSFTPFQGWSSNDRPVSASLTVRDGDYVVDHTKDPEGQYTTNRFKLTNEAVTGSTVRYLEPGANIVVRGTLQLQMVGSSGQTHPQIITAYILAVAKPDGTYDNFGMAMDRDVEALRLSWPAGASSMGLKIVGTSPAAPVPVCFSADALIQTDCGPVRAGDLTAGDLVRTRDNGFQPIRWIDSTRFVFMPFDQSAALRPIRIRAGALGANSPAQDLLVSPQHRVLVRSKIAQKMFGTDEILVAAKQLLQVDGIDIAEDLAEVTYVHFLFDQHEIVFSNGAETESLFTGPEALKTVGAAALEEIFAIFPELRDRDYTATPARPLASGRMGRKLAVRHAQNGKALVQ